MAQQHQQMVNHLDMNFASLIEACLEQTLSLPQPDPNKVGYIFQFGNRIAHVRSATEVDQVAYLSDLTGVGHTIVPFSNQLEVIVNHNRSAPQLIQIYVDNKLMIAETEQAPPYNDFKVTFALPKTGFLIF